MNTLPLCNTINSKKYDYESIFRYENTKNYIRKMQ